MVILHILTAKKCDEAHPICGNCSKHKIQCDFAPLQDDRPPRRQERVKTDPFEKWLKTEDSSSKGLSPLLSSLLSTTSLLPDTTSGTGSTSNASAFQGIILSFQSPEFHISPLPLLWERLRTASLNSSFSIITLK